MESVISEKTLVAKKLVDKNLI